MATEYEWITTNVSDRLLDKKIEFETHINKFMNVRPMPFIEAAKQVTQKISLKYDKIFIPFSGGMDSEFVFNCFREAGKNFTPIIVDTPCNIKESGYAFRKCRELKINPVIINMSEQELLQVYYDEILKKLHGIGYNSTACYIATKYAKEHEGVSVVAEHGYDGLNEWDFYNDALLGPEWSVYFYIYTPQIYYAMKNAYKGEDHQEFKHKLYNIPFRQKLKYEYSSENQEIIDNIIRAKNGYAK